ncbi:hypothetical protein SISSUDRAFT_976163, partial [Sistotremastrum suecicum HHB10207 ss-3]
AAVAGVNSGLLGWTFFGLREFIISPTLTSHLPWRQYTRRRAEREVSHHEATESEEQNPERLGPTTWSDIRRRNLLDTCLAAGITGAFFNGIRRGSSRILPGFFTASLIGTLCQSGFNESSIIRLRVLSRQEERIVYSHGPSTSAASESLPDAPKEETLSWNDTITKKWRTFLPHRISEDEFSAKLKENENK